MDALAELRSIPPQVADLARAIREACGDDDQAFADTLDGECDLIQAARGVVRLIAECDASEAAVKALVQHYSERAKTFSDRKGRARDALARFMQEIGEKKLTLPEATVSLSAGAPSVVGDPDVAQLAERFVRVKREPDRVAIKQALIDGEIVPGCSLSNSPPRLSVRPILKDN